MATTTRTSHREWTVADLHRRFGPMPVSRLRQNPAPGTATLRDVIEIHDREDRLYELVDGVLVEKTVGLYESALAVLIARLLGNFVAARNLGIVTGADGGMEIKLALVRIPDAAFISLDRFPNRRMTRKPIPRLAPDLAVEVLSESNTRKEMAEKLVDYFEAGVRLVWYVDPVRRTVKVFTAPDQSSLLHENQPLDGGDVLPGLLLPVRDIFDVPIDPPPAPKRGRKGSA